MIRRFFVVVSLLVYDLYDTDPSKSSDKYDCLRIIDTSMRTSARLEYCRRPLENIVRQKYDECFSYYADDFAYLKSENITSEDLIMTLIPMDIVDAYMLYLETGKREDNGYVCYCLLNSQQSFGAVCEYMSNFTVPLLYDPEGYSNIFGYNT